MIIVMHSKCKKCHKVLNIAELKDNEEGAGDGVGKICIDRKSCEERVANGKNNTN